VAVLPHTPLDQAVGYASKIMREIYSTTYSDPSFPTKARPSIGVTCCRNGSATAPNTFSVRPCAAPAGQEQAREAHRRP